MAQNPAQTLAPATGAPERKPRRLAHAALPVGTEVWYRLRNELTELVPAVVIDTWTDDYGMATKLLPPPPGAVHLEVQLDPQRHFSASDRALRRDVAEGTAPGTFCAAWPETEAAEYAARALRAGILREENVRRAQGRTL